MRMKMAERNALAKLAEKLNADKDIVLAFKKDIGDNDDEVGGMMISDICRASRIVAELAKVEDVTDVQNLKVIKRPNVWQSVDAISKCRAIAEEREVAK